MEEAKVISAIKDCPFVLDIELPRCRKSNRRTLTDADLR